MHSETPTVPNKPPGLVLASGSESRRNLLRAAGVAFEPASVCVDEAAIRAAMAVEGAHPRDVADLLAETKARRACARLGRELVLGCDQILAHRGDTLAKPETVGQARDQLRRLRADTHHLYSAAVICEEGAPVWRHVAVARLTMRPFSETYLEQYLARNWPAVRHCVGAYKLEEEGIRLFSRIEGDHFGILGLPLLEILAYLGRRGVIDT